MNRGITATDRVIAGYNVIIAGAWLYAADASRFAALAVLAHAAAAVLPWLLWSSDPTEPAPVRSASAWAGSRVSVIPGALGMSRSGAEGSAAFRLRSALRELYPLIAIAIFWIEMDSIIAALGRPRLDGSVMALDERVFGRHLHLDWPARMSSPALGEVMNFAYFAYYLLIFVPPLVLFIGRRTEALRDSLFRLMVAYLACYVFYLAWPTFGPRYSPGEYAGVASGVFGRVIEWIHATGDSRGTAFPSSHVAGAVTIALAGWRWFRRPVAVLFTIEAAGVVLSTVYTQNHYAIDSLVGLGGTLLLQLVLIPVTLDIARTIGNRAALPVLPDFERMFRKEPVGGKGDE